MAKSFKSEGNPAMNFISKETIDKKEKKPKSKSTAQKKEAPEGHKPNPEYIEVKSRRVQILVQPSVYDAVKAKAGAEGISTNEAINEALRAYIER